MRKLRVAAMIGFTLLAGANTANSQNTNEYVVKRVCKTVLSGARCAKSCYDVVTGGRYGSAWGQAQVMDWHRPVPTEWYPYRNEAEATYYCEQRDQLGGRQGPVQYPSQRGQGTGLLGVPMGR